MLSKKKRLTKKIFQDIIKQGRSHTNPFFVFKHMPDTNPRFAIVVPKSVTKKAVERNRLRRKGYNQLRSFSLPNKAGIFFYKKEGTQATTQDIKNDLQNILTKINNEKKT